MIRRSPAAWLGWMLLPALLLGAAFSHEQIASNLANLSLWRAVSAADPTLPVAEPLEPCERSWFRTMHTRNQGGVIPKEQVESALACGAEYIPLLAVIAPTNVEDARLATILYPQEARAWFWLAEASAPVDTAAERSAYLQTVRLEPSYGLAWCRLGRNYSTAGELQKAQEAFLNCCIYGDPGSNGCYGAGRMAEKLGDLQKAIEYYRLSRWDGALDRADELAGRLQP